MRRFVVMLGAIVTATALLVGPSTPSGAVGAVGAGPTGLHGPSRGAHPAPPDGPGRYAVGLSTVQMVDPARADRTLTVDIWYPAHRRSEAPPASLDLVFSRLALPGVLADPQAARGSFPLVVFSHGNGGVRFQSWFLMEALASHGFVVAAPDHAGNTALDAIAGTSDPIGVAAANRPRDVSFVIDEITNKLDRDAAGPLHRRIDERHIGVVGHSFGGFTALATAAGFVDYQPDPRVDAIVPIAPATFGFTDEQLASIDVPTLLMGGTSDTVVPIVPGIVRAWDLISGRPEYRVDLLAAGHNSFTNVCDIRDAYVAAGVGQPILGFVQAEAEHGCAPELLPIDEAHRVTDLYVVSFLTRELRGTSRYSRYLTTRYADRHDLPVELLVKPEGRQRGRGAA
ncbi:MAG: alpha/beta hydrolase family protein [Acidimicrobiales bacterium]